MTITPWTSALMVHIATYWAPVAANDRFGGVPFLAPVPIVCRWQEVALIFRDSEMREVSSNAIVYSSLLVEVKGYLVNGISADADPRNVEGAFEIRRIDLSPTLKQDRTLIKVWV